MVRFEKEFKEQAVKVAEKGAQGITNYLKASDIKPPANRIKLQQA